MNDIKQQGFTRNMLINVLNASWDVGACNLLGMANSLPDIIEQARQTEQGDQHPAVKLFIAHMAFLAGVGLGPEPDWAAEVRKMVEGMN